ncbi:MAG TPA: DUF3054 domain-containing protein [Halococcus sp.]|nr:DUF3054 domain-containing protein [Halococcus sp.]
MSSAVASLRARIDFSGTTLALAVCDFALISLFIVLGELQHGYDLLAKTGRVVGTALPFFIGWALAAVIFSVYTPAIYRSVRSALARTALAWVGATLIGQALRATSLFHGDFALTFLFVSIGVGLFLLLPWRAVVAFLSARA